MTKVIDDYIFELEQNLTDLPEKESQDILEFYREYLLDGDFVRRSTIEQEFGTPKQLAIKILADYSTNNNTSPIKAKAPRSNLKAIWYILLGLCAAPIGIPLILAIFLFLFVFIAICAVIFVAFITVLLSLFIVGGFTFLKSIALLFTSNWATGCYYLGIVLICLGGFLLISPFIAKVINFLIAECAKLMQFMGKKFFKKNYYQTNSNQKKEN